MVPTGLGKNVHLKKQKGLGAWLQWYSARLAGMRPWIQTPKLPPKKVEKT
jgi:hypothetical protein